MIIEVAENNLENKRVKMLSKIDNEQGFFVDSMAGEELAVLKGLIKDQYLHRINSMCPEHVTDFYQHGMKNYHQASHLVPHKDLWPKRARILGPNAFNIVTTLPFFQHLKKQLNIGSVATEEKCGWQEMYWRIVRPGNSDIGALHADRWFWDLGHGDMTEGMRRIKIWIAIEVESELSGLRVIPGSHLKGDWKYHGEVDHTGIAKPKFDEDESKLDIYNIPTNSGDFVVFHDDLIHGGMVNKSDTTRVSLEATLLIPLSN